MDMTGIQTQLSNSSIWATIHYSTVPPPMNKYVKTTKKHYHDGFVIHISVHCFYCTSQVGRFYRTAKSILGHTILSKFLTTWPFKDSAVFCCLLVYLLAELSTMALFFIMLIGSSYCVTWLLSFSSPQGFLWK